MVEQSTCEQCGALYPKRWTGRSWSRFCGITCRNTYLTHQQWPASRPRKMKICPTCGHVGYRKSVKCAKCNPGYMIGRRYRRKSIPIKLWTPEHVAYLRDHYAAEGAAKVAEALGLTLKQVRGKANVLGLKLNRRARHRIIHAKARAHMTHHNPMKHAETVEKVKAWRAAHPEAVAALEAKLLAGHQRIQRDQPSKLEQRLRTMLTELGVTFEPSALIKPRFIVDIRIGSLIIQADGDYWHGHPRFEPLTERQQAQQRRDRAQDAYLRSCGYTVVRIWESDMSRDKVAAILREHHLIPSV